VLHTLREPALESMSISTLINLTASE
jgi:hypothetical protein